MDYDRGDIILKSGLKFKGTDRLDFRLAGHPIVILKDVSFDDDYIYFLTLSSQIAHINYEPDRYYLVKKDINQKDINIFVYIFMNKIIYFSDTACYTQLIR